MGYTKYIGRSGALAVALGVTAAVASTPAISYAAPSDSGVSGGDSSSTTGDQPSAGDSSGSGGSQGFDTSGEQGSGGAGGEGQDTGLVMTAAGSADLVSMPTDDSALAKAAVIDSVDALQSSSAAVEGVELSAKAVAVDPVTDVLTDANSSAAGAVSGARDVSDPQASDMSDALTSTPASSVDGPSLEVATSVRAFAEEVALLVRRTFFNQAPTVDPVQTSGQTGGLITGTVGAVDPEGDSIIYSLTGTPQYGSVTINPGGSYTYTPGPTFDGIDTFTVTATDTGFHINLLDLFRPAGTLASLEVTQSAAGPGLTFNFIYGAGSQYWSGASRDALESAAILFSSYFVVTSPVILTYDVSGQHTPSTSTLASAASDLISTEPGFSQTVVQEKILSGVDANGSAPDGQITFNFAHSWALDSSVGDSQYDFQSVAMHELMHTFGFLSSVDSAGSNTGQNWSQLDSFIVTSDDAEVIGTDFTWDTAYNPNLTGADGGLYFGGPNAVAAYGGLVPLYTPNPWKSGSSVSHLDDSTFTGADTQLMNALADTGLGVRTISPVELGILEDLGYTVVSPPQTYALLFIAIAFVRRRKTDWASGVVDVSEVDGDVAWPSRT